MAELFGVARSTVYRAIQRAASTASSPLTTRRSHRAHIRPIYPEYYETPFGAVSADPPADLWVKRRTLLQR
ncbi:hypothetical protein [Arthrobacter sp. MMS24-S77]